MAKDISVEMKLPLEDGEELLPELEKEAEKEDKENTKALDKATDVVDDINAPKGVEIPKEVEIKPLTEKLHLNEEELEDIDMFNLVHELYNAMRTVCERWAKNSAADYEDFEEAIKEAASTLIGDEPELWESLEEACDKEEALEECGAPGMIEEEFKVTSTLQKFQPWSGAVTTWDKIKTAGLIDELDSLLEEVYPEGLSETELNDLLWFEPEWILESLGLSEEETDEE